MTPTSQKIRVLVVCSGNAENFSFPLHQAFIYDQMKAVNNYSGSVEFENFFIRGKGIKGYINNLPGLKNKIAAFAPHLIHAHGGHAGLLCGLQRKIPVLVTFHGSDINLAVNRIISLAATFFCKKAIYVSHKMKDKMPFTLKKPVVIPCGVDFDIFHPVPQPEARRKLGFDADKKYILFSSGFNNRIKNFPLAHKAVTQSAEIEIEEISNRTREEVNLLMNGAELLLLTSFSEGSPQVIKEAMACNCPVVATDVGDIREVISDTPGCYVTTFDPADVADKIRQALAFGKRTNGREKIAWLDNKVIAERIVEVYDKVIR